MKNRYLVVAGSVGMLLLLASCAVYSKTSFSRWSGPNTFMGKGGTKRVASGLDIWITGEPDRPYRLLGLIDQSTFNDNSALSVMAALSADSAIVNEAKKHGADALIVIANNTSFQGYNLNPNSYGHGSTLSSNNRRYAAVKYLSPTEFVAGSGGSQSLTPEATGAKADLAAMSKAMGLDVTEDKQAYLKANIQEIEIRAKAGDHIAEHELATAYDSGIGKSRDAEKAIGWLTKAANGGYAPSQFALGIWAMGRNEPDTAVSWLRKAADQSNTSAMAFLGFFYRDGVGVPRDLSKAISFLRASAEAGNVVGQVFFGQCYEEGEGVPKDDVEAYKWYNLASAVAPNYASEWREGLASKMTPEQIAEAQRRSSAFTPRRAVQQPTP